MRYKLKIFQWHSYKVPWIVEGTSQPEWWQFWAKPETHRYVSEVGIIWYRQEDMRECSYSMNRMLENFVRKQELRKKLDNCVVPLDDN